MEGCAEMVVMVDRGSAGRIAVPSGLVAQWDSAGMNPLLSTWKSVETDSALRAQSEGFAWTEQAALRSALWVSPARSW